MRVLVTGGAGYIGSHAVRALIARGHTVTVLDNLSHGHREAVDPKAELIMGSTANTKLLMHLFDEYDIEAVMHFAADIEVGESVTDPAKYYENNFSHTLNLLKTMRACGVMKLVFSSTAAVYGNPEQVPIAETQPRAAINPYGRSKAMVEMAIEDFAHAYGLQATIFRYFNVAGADPKGDIGEDHHPETHLIPKILKAALSETPEVKIFGTDYPTADGTCVRDYVHVVDLAQAHVLGIENVGDGAPKIYNLGSEKGFSVREVIAACEKVIGRSLSVSEEGRRAGDPAVLVANNRKAMNELGWRPNYPAIEDIVRHAWSWHQTHPHGYNANSAFTSFGAKPPLVHLDLAPEFSLRFM